MAGVRFWEESLSEHLQNEERAFDEWIPSGEEVIIPDALAV